MICSYNRVVRKNIMRFFGQTPDCTAQINALQQAQANIPVAMAQDGGVPGANYNAALAAQATAGQNLANCQNSGPSTAQQFQQGAAAAGSILGPLASLGTGIFKMATGAPTTPVVAVPGVPVASSSNTTLIIVGVVAVVVVLLVVLMKK